MPVVVELARPCSFHRNVDTQGTLGAHAIGPWFEVVRQGLFKAWLTCVMSVTCLVKKKTLDLMSHLLG